MLRITKIHRQMQLAAAILLVLGIAGSVAAHLSADELFPTVSLFGNQYLFYGQSITDMYCRFRLVMQSDGNLVLYDEGRPRWASNTVGCERVNLCVARLEKKPAPVFR